ALRILEGFPLTNGLPLAAGQPAERRAECRVVERLDLGQRQAGRQGVPRGDSRREVHLHWPTRVSRGRIDDLHVDLAHRFPRRLRKPAGLVTVDRTAISALQDALAADQLLAKARALRHPHLRREASQAAAADGAPPIRRWI